MGFHVRLISIAATATAVMACKSSEPAPAGPPSASPSSAPAPSAATSASASGSAVVPAVATTAVGAAPQGTGVTEFIAASQTEACKVRSADIGSYLQRGELALGGGAGGIAVSWLALLGAGRGAQLAFAGFDGEARQVARPRGVGEALEQLPRLFATGDGWTLAWFDPTGFAYARPRWESTPPPPVEHLGAIGTDAPENTAVSMTPTGSLVAVAPFGGDKSRLGLFLFAPIEADAPPLKALGATRHAKQPSKPAVAASADGYYVAWQEEGGRIAASRFDLNGKESDEAHTIVAAGEPPRERFSLTATAAGAIAVWAEGETILARALDPQGKPSSPPSVVGKGRWVSVIAGGEGALVAWVGTDKDAAHRLLAVRLGKDAVPAGKGLRVTESAVKDPPALAVAGDRAAFGWMEVMSPVVSTKRAVLRTVELSCLP